MYCTVNSPFTIAIHTKKRALTIVHNFTVSIDAITKFTVHARITIYKKCGFIVCWIEFPEIIEF